MSFAPGLVFYESIQAHIVQALKQIVLNVRVHLGKGAYQLLGLLAFGQLLKLCLGGILGEFARTGYEFQGIVPRPGYDAVRLIGTGD